MEDKNGLLTNVYTFVCYLAKSGVPFLIGILYSVIRCEQDF